MIKKLFSIFLIGFLHVCAANAQSSGIGGPMVPSTAPFTGFSLLSKSGASASHTGDTNESVLATIAIPPNTVGANGQIRVNSYWAITNSANNKTPRVRLGTTGITSTQISTLNAPWTTFTTGWVSVQAQNANATNSQNDFTEAGRGTDSLLFTVSTTSAVDMTVAQNIYITGQLALGTETITLVFYTVEYVN